MPVYKCPDGKYRIGAGKCMYKTKADADKAYAAYLVVKHVKPTKELPFAGSKIRSKGKGRGLAIGRGVGPIGRM